MTEIHATRSKGSQEGIASKGARWIRKTGEKVLTSKHDGFAPEWTAGWLAPQP